MLDYKNLVLILLKKKQFPVLLDYIIIDIYYRMLKPLTIGDRYYFSVNCPETIFEKENEASKIVYMHSEGAHFYVHKNEPDTINIFSLPLECIKIKINRGFINKLLNLKCNTFEEEIYTLIKYLNFDIPKIRDVLNLSYVKSTCFIPNNIKLWVPSYKTQNIGPTSKNVPFFGPTVEEICVRWLMGKLSECISKETILSCNNAKAIEDEKLVQDMPSYTINYNLYNMHYIPDYETYIPLAYNPLENPIIQMFQYNI